MIARLAWLVLVLAPAAAAQSTWYVDAAAAAPGDGSLAAPFPTIQAGVDAAAHGDVVSVAPGEYEESVVIPQQTAIRVESQAGPLATTLRAAGPGAAFHCEHFVQVDAYVPAIVGFTVTDSDVGVSDDAMLLVQRCILTGNGAGTHGQSPFLDHSTVVGNDVGVREKGYGVVATHSIVWGNASWDYANLSIGAFGSFSDCVGLMKVQESGAGISFDHVLHGDPELWGPGYGELHLQPGSPCIDFAGPDDVGALEFDPAYGADFRDVGFALAGTGAAPALAATGYMFPGEPVVLQVTGGPAGGSAIVALGLSAAYAPLLGGTLVPVPDAVLAPLLLDGAGALTLPAFVWPAVLPSGTAFYAQAWVPDPGGPAGFAATNGLQATTP